jgi:hypothetical protein
LPAAISLPKHRRDLFAVDFAMLHEKVG